jgi:phage gp16-like protein
MIAKIQIARKQLGMNEDDYRQGVFDASGRLSLTECTDNQLHRILEWLKGKGFKPLPSARAAAHPMAQKARALWVSLYHLGAVHNAAESALEAFAKRQLKCERLVWARQSDAFRLIEALKSMGERHGWLQHDRCTSKRLEPITLQASLCSAILIKLKDRGVVPADWALHDAAKSCAGSRTVGSGPGQPKTIRRSHLPWAASCASWAGMAV